jgi:hypothetical protein
VADLSICTTNALASCTTCSTSRKAISRDVYEYCLREKIADADLIAKWKKAGYERLCCMRVCQFGQSQLWHHLRLPRAQEGLGRGNHRVRQLRLSRLCDLVIEIKKKTKQNKTEIKIHFVQSLDSLSSRRKCLHLSPPTPSSCAKIGAPQVLRALLVQLLSLLDVVCISSLTPTLALAQT